MKNYKKIISSFIFACIVFCATQAQVVINFSPNIYGQTLEGLAYARIVNTYSSDLMARVSIKVKESRNGNVVSIRMPSFHLRPGINEINRSAFANAKFAFGNNNFGLALSQTGRFMEGDYEYCFEVDISESKATALPLLYENCFIYQLQPRTPLLLINPVDGDVFCNSRPQFIWQPPSPVPFEAKFRFVLTNVNDKQDVVEAITFNPPLVNQDNIPGNTIFYPSNAPALQEGKKYAWQIIMYAHQTILARSEVWTFIYNCNEKKRDTVGDSFRELKELPDGNFYIANNFLRFSFMNPYGIGDLNYTITSLANPTSIIRGLPKLKVTPGINKYTIDLSENRFMKDGQEYLLTVALANNRNLELRFIYKSN